MRLQCVEQVIALERMVQSSTRDIDRVGAGYALGLLAAGDTPRRIQLDALDTLNRLIDGHNNARRSAMYGLACAGTSAVDLLMQRIARPDDYPLCVVVAAVFALGEAGSQPTTEVVCTLGNLLVRWRSSMETYCAEAALATVDTQHSISKTDRARLTSGGATSMNPMDGFATAMQRAAATVSIYANSLTTRHAAVLLQDTCCHPY